MVKQITNDIINIVMFSITGLEHNFEKYTVGEVKRLPANEEFYDFDVSKTQENRTHRALQYNIG